MKKIFALVILTFFSISCSPIEHIINGCIAPESAFAYRADTNGQVYPGKEIPPPFPWEKEVNLPSVGFDILAVRKINYWTKEVWFWNNTENNGYPQNVYVYNTNTKNVKTVKMNINPGIGFPELKLIIVNNDSIWIVYSFWEIQRTTILGKYQDTSESIEPVMKLEGAMGYGPLLSAIVFDDQAEALWILIGHDNIYRFDVRNKKLERHVSISEYYPTSVVLSQEGDIYFYNDYSSDIDEKIYQGERIKKYSPKEEKIDNIFSQLEQDNYQKNLFIDQSERLWTGSLGWMDPDGTWFQILQSPLFVTSNIEVTDYRYHRWQPPQIIAEQPENYFWFSGPGGLYSLDINKEAWCWVSTTTSDLVKDSDGDLWIVGGNSIYHLPVTK